MSAPKACPTSRCSSEPSISTRAERSPSPARRAATASRRKGRTTDAASSAPAPSPRASTIAPTNTTGVRYGLPQGLGGLADVISSPTWAAASGLLLYGRAAEQGKEKKRRPGFSVRAVMGSLRGMFEDLL